MPRINLARMSAIHLQFGMRGTELLGRLERLQGRAEQDQGELARANPGWDAAQDARPRALAKLVSAVARTRLGVHLLGELLNDAWWQTRNPGVPMDHRDSYALDYEGYLKYGFGMSCFTTIENYMRIFMRSLDPRACQEATLAFRTVYKHLLGSRWLKYAGDEQRDAFALLDLVCRLRNLIHNDGVCFNRSLQDEDVVYRGDPYTFPHAVPVTFVTWDLLLTLADDIRQLLFRVISHEKIAGQESITDPFTLLS